jgi:hypothetical protein
MLHQTGHHVKSIGSNIMITELSNVGLVLGWATASEYSMMLTFACRAVSLTDLMPRAFDLCARGFSFKPRSAAIQSLIIEQTISLTREGSTKTHLRSLAI